MLNASNNEEEDDGDVGDSMEVRGMEEDRFLSSLPGLSGGLMMNEEQSTGNSLLELERGNEFNRTTMARDLSLVSPSNSSKTKYLESGETGTYGGFRDPDFFDDASPSQVTPALPVNLFEGFDDVQSAAGN